jgi:hypothetical protein
VSKAKQKEIDGLDEHLATANKYKETYDKRMEENMTEVTERAKVLMSSIAENATWLTSCQRMICRLFIIISSVWIGFREIRLPYIKRLLIVACLFPIVLHNGYCAMKFSLMFYYYLTEFPHTLLINHQENLDSVNRQL